MKRYVSDYPKHKAEHSRRLRAPQTLPFYGDGLRAQAVLSPRRGGPDSYLGRNKHGYWDSIPIVTTREALVEARYLDWLDSRNTQPLAA